MWLLLGTLLWSLCLCSQTSIFHDNSDWLLQIKKQLVISTVSETGGRGCGGELFATRKFNSPFKKFKTRRSSPNNTCCAGNFSLGKVVIFPLPPSGIPTPLQGNFGKVPYTPFATRKIYPLHIPTQLILGMKISLIVKVSLLILHPDPFLFKIIQLILLPLHILHSCENLVTLSFDAWKCTLFGYILIYAVTGNTPCADTWSPLLPLKTDSQIKI